MAIQSLSNVAFTVAQKELSLNEQPKTFLKRLYQQSKQLSQIIAYIWRWVDADETPRREIANQLKEYFVHPTESNHDVGGNLKKLLAANPKEDKPERNRKEAQLLREVFPDYNSNKNLIFPMFDEFELGDEHPGLGYLFTIDINSFHGKLDDPTKNAPEVLKFVIPYPPRPVLGEATVTASELESWIENKQEYKYFADNPYIPATCS